MLLRRLGSVSSDSDTDSTITEGPYPGQDSAPGSTAMQRYYAMMSSRPAPLPEDRRILPPQPQASIITPRAPTISQQSGIVGPTRPPAPVQRLTDAQAPMPRDSLVLQSAPSMQRQDSGYGGVSMMPRRPSLERDQRPILPPGLSTSPGARSSMSGQPSAPPAYMVGSRIRRDSLSPPAPPVQQGGRRESIVLASRQPGPWDPTQPSAQPVRRDSIHLAQPPPHAIHRNSLALVPQPPPAPVRRATDPLPMAIPPPQPAVRRASESQPRGQGILVSTRVRFNDENLICPSPVPMHERRKGFHNRRGCVPSHPTPRRLCHTDADLTRPFFRLAGTNCGRTREITSRRHRDRNTRWTSPTIRTTAKGG